MGAFGAFAAAGKWLRSNRYTHTIPSDGESSAARVAEAYRRRAITSCSSLLRFRECDSSSATEGGRCPGGPQESSSS